MPIRQVANVLFTLGTQTSSGAALGPVPLGAPFSLFTIQGRLSATSGTFAGSLYGGTSSGLSTDANINAISLGTISNSTAYAYNSSAVPCSWLMYASSSAPSTGHTLVVSVACAG